MSIIDSSPDGMWLVEQYERSDDSYMYSYTRVTTEIIHAPSGDVVLTFSLSDDADSTGRRRSGTESVRFTPDGRFVEAVDTEGEVRRHELVWPEPPPEVPQGIVMPKGWEELRKEHEEEYRDKLARKDQIEAEWRKRKSPPGRGSP